MSIIFRKPADDVALSNDTPVVGNVLTVPLSGSGPIDLRVVVRHPGAQFALATGTTALLLAVLSDTDPLPPSVTLINDVVLGDRSLHTRHDGLGHHRPDPRRSAGSPALAPRIMRI